ncbi:MAG: hypothetical protein JHC33_08855 [Ignisphaera sp.]|nr:hypothetical protein [Ignisphaera sp.]
MHIYKTPVVIREDYIIYIELVDMTYLFIHSDVYKWDRSIKAYYRRDLSTLASLSDVALLVYVDKANTKLKKFTELNGCTLVEENDAAYIYRVEEI